MCAKINAAVCNTRNRLSWDIHIPLIESSVSADKDPAAEHIYEPSVGSPDDAGEVHEETDELKFLLAFLNSILVFIDQ